MARPVAPLAAAGLVTPVAALDCAAGHPPAAAACLAGGARAAP